MILNFNLRTYKHTSTIVSTSINLAVETTGVCSLAEMKMSKEERAGHFVLAHLALLGLIRHELS